MADAQGTATVIGEFLKGYMGETARLEKKKYEDLSTAMGMAEKFEKLASDPSIDENQRKQWSEYHVQAIADANKIWKQKNDGLGSIMKLFGFGKKQPNGGIAAPPLDYYKRTDGGGGVPAAMVRPSSLGPAPADDSGNAPPEFMGPGSLGYFQQQQLGAPAPGSPGTVAPVANSSAPPDKYAGMNKVMAYQQRTKDLDAARGIQNSVDIATATGRVTQGFDRENYFWKEQEVQRANKEKLSAYRASPSYGKDPEYDKQVETALIAGVQPKQQTPYRRTYQTYDRAGNPVLQTTEDGRVIDEIPARGMANEAQIRAIVADEAKKGNQISYKQAEEIYGKGLLDRSELDKKAKQQSMENQASIARYRQEKIDVLKAKKANGGALTTAQAISLHRAAMGYGRSMLAMDSINALTMSDAEKQAFVNNHARQYVEGGAGQEGVMKWDDLMKVVNPSRQVAPPQQKGASFFDNQVKKSSTSTSPAKPFALPK